MKRKTTFELVAAILLLMFFFGFADPVLPTAVIGPNLDLFTQKTPFNGVGPNQTSDAFQQQNLVILYAIVTYSEDPIANEVVGYQVNGPPNIFENFTLTVSTTTNQSGIAVFSFRIPIAAAGMESEVFGNWTAIANVNVDQVVVGDTLTFQVGWLISISNITTLDVNLNPQTNFTAKSPIVFNLTLQNIALTPQNATVTVSSEDAKGQPIAYVELDNQEIPPRESHVHCSSQIAENATIGVANATASVFNSPPSAGGVPYSPSVYVTFNIVTTQQQHDIAVTNVTASPSHVFVGDNVDITVQTANFGNFVETYNVTVYYNQGLIQTIPVLSLATNSSETVKVEWDTLNIEPGTYEISANATAVQGETNMENNRFVDGTITVTARPNKPVIIDTYTLLLLLFIGFAVLGALAFMLLLIAANRTRRRKARRKSKYVVIEHPHV